MKLDLERIAERFWKRVNKTETCWLWIGRPRPKGYGTFNAVHPRHNLGLSALAHRWAYELTYGPIPDGLYVCHKCDVPACVRPDHLFLGTKAENNADMIAKGRQAVGEARGSKFTAAQVIEMRDMANAGKTIGEIAQKFRHNHSNISMIVQGVTWKHLLRPCDIIRGRKTSMGMPVKSQ